MKYYIRTTLDRILNDTYSQIDHELLVDTEHNNVKAFISQIKYLASLNEDVVILEDDVVLCRDFKRRIEDVINQHKNMLINFFYSPNTWMPKEQECDIFLYMQCVYFPKHILKILADNLDKFYNLLKWGQSDFLVSKVLEQHKIKFLVYRPCLVQHLSFDTLIHNKVCEARTDFFIDYLEDLNMTYEDAKTISNRNKLYEYRKGWFDNYEKDNRLHTS